MTKDALDDFPSKQEILNAIFDAVYAQYPKKKWQGLTDDEITKVYKNSLIVHSDTHYEFNNFKFARAIEQALKDKNTCS